MISSEGHSLGLTLVPDQYSVSTQSHSTDMWIQSKWKRLFMCILIYSINYLEKHNIKRFYLRFIKLWCPDEEAFQQEIQWLWFEDVNWLILSLCCVKVFTVKRLIFTLEQLIQAVRTGPATINSLISHRGHPSCQHLTAQAVTWLRHVCESISVTSKYCYMRLMNSLSWLSSLFEPPERKPVQTNPHPTWRWTTPSHFLRLPFSSWFIFPLKPCWLCRQICTETTTRWGCRTATCRHRGCSALSAFISAVVGRHPAFPSTPTRPLWKQPEPSPVDGVRWIRQGVVLPACRLCPNLVFLIYANSEAWGRWGQGSWIPPNELTPPFIISTLSYLYTTD